MCIRTKCQHAIEEAVCYAEDRQPAVLAAGLRKRGINPDDKSIWAFAIGMLAEAREAAELEHVAWPGPRGYGQGGCAMAATGGAMTQGRHFGSRV